MEILDDEDRAAPPRVRGEESAPRPGDRRRDDLRIGSLEGLPGITMPADVARAWTVSSVSASVSPSGARIFVSPSRRRCSASSGAIIEPDGAGASEDLAQRPVARGPPACEAAALEDRRGRCSLASRGQELPNEPALADPGRAVHEDEAWLPFAERIVEGPDQHLELRRAPDERRLKRGLTHDRFGHRRP